MAGRGPVMIWCSHSGKDAQYARSQAAVAATTAAARSVSGVDWIIIRSASSASGRKCVLVSRSSSTARRRSSAAASGPGRGPPRRALASEIMAWMRSLARAARGSTEPVMGWGL